MTLKEGTKAPAFNLPDQNGDKHRLSAYKDQWVLVYFYPKDNTSGCTKEACAIRDNFPAFKKLKIKVFGVSKDSVASHARFVDKYELPFTLLSDEGLDMLKKYGVWQKKKMAGREYMGIVRISYLIDPKGKIAKVYPKVKPPEHAEQVLEDLKGLI
ncbi:MAG: thioredoxin-dependent thiol peroxidase [Candidatus Krumholzibacteria bacterium]|nr:thioredoxin-dependent thiol peroxidase [Candidatus Krumholzibacteria bacterium]